MKIIISRIKLDMKRKPLSFILKMAVFTILFSLLFTSLTIQIVSKKIETDIFNKMKIYLTMTSNVNDSRYHANGTQDYLNHFEEYYRLNQELSNSENIVYHDLNISTNNIFFPLMLIDAIPEKNYIQFLFHDSSMISDNEIYNHAQCLLNEKVCFSTNLAFRSVQTDDFLDSHFDSIELSSIPNNRVFTNDEIEKGAHVCLVPRVFHLYTYKDGQLVEEVLNIGDRIPVSEYVKDEEGHFLYIKKHEFEIIGFYHLTEKGEQYNQFFDSYHPVYVPEKALIPLVQSSLAQTKKLNPIHYDSLFHSSSNKMFMLPAIYQIDDLEGLKSFLSEFGNSSIEYSDYQLFSTISSSLVFLNNIQTISSSFKYISMIAFFACVLISIAVLFFDVIQRREEIGILLSLGEKKKNVVLQFLLEVVLTSIVSVLISIFLTFNFTNSIAHYLMDHASQSLVEENTLFVEEEDEWVVIEDVVSGETFFMFGVYLILIFISELGTMVVCVDKVNPKELLEGD